MQHPEHDRSVWEKHTCEEGEKHSEVEDPESSLHGTEVHFFGLVLVFVIVDCLADSYEEEEHDWDDDVECVEVFIKGEYAEIVKVPEEVQGDHENNGASSEEIEFNESLLLFLFSFWIWSGIHRCFLLLSLLVIDIM